MFQTKNHSTDSIKTSRRRFLVAGTLMLPALTVPTGFAWATTRPHRSLRLYHTHTGERLELTYFESGQYLGDALVEINQFLRDFRTGEVHAINPQLIDRLDVLRSIIEPRAEYQIISGYRSPKTNQMLRQKSKSGGVAKKSMHMTGNAIDVRLTGVNTHQLRDAARSLKAGGVGYYGRSDFVHLDTGRTRFW